MEGSPRIMKAILLNKLKLLDSLFFPHSKTDVSEDLPPSSGFKRGQLRKHIRYFPLVGFPH